MSRFGLPSFALVAVLLTSCEDLPALESGESGGSGGDTATIVLALTTVPADVSCLEVTVSGAQVTTQRFDVTPNQPAVITVQGLASGAATIAERAFAVPCAQVTPTTPATWLSTMPVSVTLAPGQIADVTIVLRRAGQVRITTDFQDGTGSFSVAPSMVSFGNVTLGVSAATVVTITNTGAASAPVPALGITGPDAGQFMIQSSPNTGAPACATTASLPAGGACATLIQFLPTSNGAKTAVLNVGASAAGSPAATVPLSGTGVTSGMTFMASPNPVAFGNVGVGVSASVIVTVTNTSTVTTAPPALTVTGPDAPQFVVEAPANTGLPSCAASTSLPAGAGCTTSVRFSPTSTGNRSAVLNVGFNAAGVPLATVALSGTGVGPTFSASPNPVAFGNVGVGVNAFVTVTITNTSAFATAPPALTVTGPDAPQFAVVATTNTGLPPCATSTSLPAGAGCTTSVRFSPTSTGNRSAVLNIGFNVAGVPLTTVALSGTGVNPTFSASPNPVAFGNVGVGVNAFMTVTITNTSAFATPPPPLNLVGTNAGQFAIQASTNTGNPPCATSTSLPAGGACTTSVRFIPASTGAKTATLNIGFNAAGLPLATAALTGTGV